LVNDKLAEDFLVKIVKQITVQDMMWAADAIYPKESKMTVE
jgi:hypothetical protein